MGKKFKHIEKKTTLVGIIRRHSRAFFITTGLIFVVSIFWNYGTTFTSSQKVSEETLKLQLESAPSVVDGEPIDEVFVSRLLGSKVQQWRMQNPSSAPGIMEMIQFRTESMDEIIERRILLNEAKFQKIEISEKNIDERRERDLESFFIEQDEEGNFLEKFKNRKEAKREFFKRISGLGMSETEYINAIKEDLMIEEIEVSISLQAQSESAMYQKDLTESIKESLSQGKSLTEIGLEINGSPGVRVTASRWVTRNQATSELIPFEELLAGKVSEYSSNNENNFSISLEYREASGEGFEKFKKERSSNKDALDINSLVSEDESDAKNDYEAIRIQNIKISTPLNEFYQDIKSKIRLAHEVKINDQIYVIYKELLLGNYESSSEKSLEETKKENARNEYFALCAWSFLLKNKTSSEGADSASLAEAKNCSNQLLDLTPFDPYTLLLSARVEIELGNNEKALEIINSSKEFRGQNLNISFQISSLFREAGSEEMASLEDEERSEIINNFNNQLF